MTSLRAYQQNAIDAVLEYWATGGGNPLVDMATGTGKSVVIATLVKLLVEQFPDLRIVMLVHVRELVEQNAKALLRVWPQAPIGINSAGLGRRDKRSQILFASIQSIFRETPKTIGKRDLILIDEAHLVPKTGEGMYRTFIESMQSETPDLRIAGFSATPFRMDAGRLDEGDNRLFSEVVYTYGIGQGIADGFLSPLTSKATVTALDVSGVKKSGGEFMAGALEAAVDKDWITQAAVDEIIQFGASRRSWLLFGSGVQHAMHLRDEVRSRGISAECVTGETPKGERDRLIRDFKDGRIRCLSNAQVLCLDEETEILTSSGFVGIDDMTPEHLVAAWREDGGIEFTPPKTIVRRPRLPGEEMVTFGDGIAARIRVTANHRMVIRCGGHKRGFGRVGVKVVSASDLVAKACSIPTCGVSEPERIEVATPLRRQGRAIQIRATIFNLRKRGYSEDVAKTLAVQQVDRLLSMRYASPHDLTEDDCRLIGFWLGDGSLGGGRCSFAQSMRYLDNIEWFDGVLARCGITHSRNIRPKSGNLSHDAVIWTLARGTGGYGQSVPKGCFYLEPYLKKTGTHLFLHFSRNQLDALLEGFWRADGNHHSHQKYTYVVGAQYALYDVLQSACSMRGISATISRPILPRKANHSVQWRFAWGNRVSWSYVPDTIHIDPEWRKERVWCVTSSTSYLVCRRNGKVFVTGNTTGFDAPAVDLVAMLRPTLSTGLYVQICGRGTRLAPGKTDCLVLDFAGNVRRHGPVDAINPRGSGFKAEVSVKEDSVRAKECPGCKELVALNTRVCQHCGHEWPRDETPKHDARADAERPIMSTGAVSNWLEVSETRFFRHAKIGSPTSMRVEYTAGLTVYRQWVCFEHDGFARQKAESWWRRMGMGPCPKTVTEALERQNEIMPAAEIQVRPSGQYFEVVAVRALALEAAE